MGHFMGHELCTEITLQVFVNVYPIDASFPNEGLPKKRSLTPSARNSAHVCLMLGDVQCCRAETSVALWQNTDGVYTFTETDGMRIAAVQ